jgi:hypothetical protein
LYVVLASSPHDIYFYPSFCLSHRIVLLIPFLFILQPFPLNLIVLFLPFILADELANLPVNVLASLLPSETQPRVCPVSYEELHLAGLAAVAERQLQWRQAPGISNINVVCTPRQHLSQQRRADIVGPGRIMEERAPQK